MVTSQLVQKAASSECTADAYLSTSLSWADTRHLWWVRFCAKLRLLWAMHISGGGTLYWHVRLLFLCNFAAAVVFFWMPSLGCLMLYPLALTLLFFTVSFSRRAYHWLRAWRFWQIKQISGTGLCLSVLVGIVVFALLLLLLLTALAAFAFPFVVGVTPFLTFSISLTVSHVLISLLVGLIVGVLPQLIPVLIRFIFLCLVDDRGYCPQEAVDMSVCLPYRLNYPREEDLTYQSQEEESQEEEKEESQEEDSQTSHKELYHCVKVMLGSVSLNRKYEKKDWLTIQSAQLIAMVAMLRRKSGAKYTQYVNKLTGLVDKLRQSLKAFTWMKEAYWVLRAYQDSDSSCYTPWLRTKTPQDRKQYIQSGLWSKLSRLPVRFIAWLKRQQYTQYQDRYWFAFLSSVPTIWRRGRIMNGWSDRLRNASRFWKSDKQISKEFKDIEAQVVNHLALHADALLVVNLLVTYPKLRKQLCGEITIEVEANID